MINDKLPDLHQPLADLIRSIAPDVTARVVTLTDDTCFVDCSFGGRSMSVRHKNGEWRTRGGDLSTEADLVEHLCWLVDAPRIAGPADIAEMRRRVQDSDAVADRTLWAHCNSALNRMDSAAIMACSRALPNNDWSKHEAAGTTHAPAAPPPGSTQHIVDRVQAGVLLPEEGKTLLRATGIGSAADALVEEELAR